MATLITHLPSIIFPYEVDSIAVSSKEAARIKLELDGTSLFDVQLIPDTSGVIRMFDLMSLLNDALTGNFAKHIFSVHLDNALVASTFVIPCRNRLDRTASEVAALGFLTMLESDVKYIPAEASEVLYWVGPCAETGIQVESTWADSNGNEWAEHSQTMPFDKYGKDYCSADVSPGLVAPPEGGEDWVLVEYTVHVGTQRQMTYRMAPLGSYLCSPTAMGFINSFGVEDTVYLYGAAEKEMKPEYAAAVTGGLSRNYRITCQPTWKASAGDHCDLGLLLDFCTSPSAWRMDNLAGITVTESDIKQSNDYSARPESTISWRESKRGARFEPHRIPRTFDETFDQTFH